MNVYKITYILIYGGSRAKYQVQELTKTSKTGKARTPRFEAADNK